MGERGEQGRVGIDHCEYGCGEGECCDLEHWRLRFVYMSEVATAALDDRDSAASHLAELQERVEAERQAKVRAEYGRDVYIGDIGSLEEDIDRLQERVGELERALQRIDDCDIPPTHDARDGMAELCAIARSVLPSQPREGG